MCVELPQMMEVDALWAAEEVSVMIINTFVERACLQLETVKLVSFLLKQVLHTVRSCL